ncbi:GGDEF domain-containing response regulator [Lutispora sp.]|uniref:GGDEF domain-containing response regulator n=1 Tax=Lutispora sp. TaxID=2828727 RepID=UPI002B205A72|nr:diguanylate cyclase [Lutispora sp.]MEA4962444.1 diguanylate cyclase [Lutispora sp.]
MKQKNILLVEDSRLSSKIISDSLIENGYKVEIVDTGEAAVKKACNSLTDLIIMDIELAGCMNGIVAAHKILERMDIPIVFLTGNASKEIFQELTTVQAYGFVLKGTNGFSLLSTIEMALTLHEEKKQTKVYNNELTKAHEELEASRKEYLELAENAPVGILKCDNNGNIIFVNQSALEILGSPSAEETKKINIFTIPALVHCGLSDQLKKCMMDNVHGIYEMNYESKWGKKTYIRLHFKPFTGPYNSNGAQLIIDDITEQKLLEEKLRILSSTDPLTSIYNRRYFVKKLEEEFHRVQKQGSGTFSVALLDIDHFKSINDYFGHHAGDNVLIKLTETINNRIRKIDCFARWGGEEFIILFPGIKLAEAKLLIEEARNSISKMDTLVANSITVSIGVTEYCANETVDSIIQRADNLMYEAKNAGRNCVRSC